MRDSIKIEQALFGYHAGHNLVAASVPLAPRVRQFLATITDSSGPENATGFEVAFTGMPVPETDFYALFCTWPAPEMPRPGCVWSHVLLIELTDLARIPDLSQLRRLCARPASPLRISDYQTPLTFVGSVASMVGAEAPDPRRTVNLIRALYEHPTHGIVILDQAGAPWELATFCVWSQQWPRLRREFAFSVGSLGDRRQAGVPFDLQIAPLSSERLWRRIELPTLVLNYASSAPDWLTASPAPWIDSAAEDLKDGAQGVLRQFLFNFGSDTEKPRAAFAKLAVAHGIIAQDSNANWGELLRSVGEDFPSQTEVVLLKRTLTMLPESLASAEKLERAWTIASFILGAQEAEAYPRADINFGNAAAHFWTQKRDEVITLLGRLVRRKESPLAASFVGAIAKAVDCAALKYISERHDELVPMIISHHPALAFEVDTWNLQGYVQSQIYEALNRLSLREEDWGKIVGAMLIAATYVSVREAVERAGSCVMHGAFQWLENPVAQQVLPSQPWREALAAPAAELLGRDNKLSPAELAFSAWCIPPEIVQRILSAERDDVQNLASQPLENLPLPLRVPTAFLLTTLGLGATTDAGTSLIVRSFYPLHDALAAREYREESWSLLASQLPYLGLWRDWDRCEKLRRAVNGWLTQHVKAGNPLREVATTPERRKLALRVSDSEAEADDFLD